MKEFGEVLQKVKGYLIREGTRCVDNRLLVPMTRSLIIGGSYGEGKRGGQHSTFLCGLRLDGDPPTMKYRSAHCI
jgi:hypothetical protein